MGNVQTGRDSVCVIDILENMMSKIKLCSVFEIIQEHSPM